MHKNAQKLFLEGFLGRRVQKSYLKQAQNKLNRLKQHIVIIFCIYVYILCFFSKYSFFQDKITHICPNNPPRNLYIFGISISCRFRIYIGFWGGYWDKVVKISIFSELPLSYVPRFSTNCVIKFYFFWLNSLKSQSKLILMSF